MHAALVKFGHMLERLSISRYSCATMLTSDNPRSADNQQERLIGLGWIVGFVDGEGCFSVYPVWQQDRQGRKGYRTGIQVQHEFVVTQGARSIGCLHELQQFFGVGQ